MLLPIANVLTAEQVAHCRARLEGADWADGRITAGHQSAKAKDNAQLPEDSEVARELGAIVLEALSRNSTFFSAALPKRVFPPLFNRYAGGQSFDYHVDNAIRYDRSGGRAEAVRTDLSATLFLSAPEDYDGGELVIEDTFGTQQRQAGRRRSGALPRHQPAQSAAGDARHATGVVLLDTEHGARGCAAPPDVRPGRVYPQADAIGTRPSRTGRN